MTKKLDRTSISLDEASTVLKNEMVGEHRAESFTEYVKGLLILDAVVFSDRRDLTLSNFPNWLHKDYPPELLIALQECRARFKPSLPTTLADLVKLKKPQYKKKKD